MGRSDLYDALGKRGSCICVVLCPALVGSLAIGTTFFLSPVAGILTDKIGIRTTTFIGGLLASGGMLLSSLCTRVLAALMALVMPCALLFKPVPVSSSQPQRRDNSLASQLKSLVNVDIWKRRKYVIWALVVPLALFGYFVPYVHMVKFVEIKFPESDGKLLVMCIGITSGVGRLIFGKIADIPRVNRIFLQQISFLSIGLLTMLLTVTNSFALLVVIALCMGIFDGCFISLLGPIAFEICGHKGATQAIGFLLGFCSIPLTLGPPIAGLIFDHTNSYYIPFLLAGVPPILGALALFAVCCVSEDEKEGVSLAMVDASTPLQNGKGPVLDKSRGTWVQVLATSYTSATSPYYIPECHHLLTSPGHHTGSLQCHARGDKRCYSYSIL
uniref:Monocarboxylate transporter 10 n=2 Tax=Timema TaxID=61471 RepID=A0A7R9G3B0_TIMSH|nr:unnamed protein product [Timema shepardi]